MLGIVNVNENKSSIDVGGVAFFPAAGSGLAFGSTCALLSNVE